VIQVLLEWEYYEPDTWAAERSDHVFLIKLLREGQYIYVFGTSIDAQLSGESGSLSHAQALANRYLFIVNNCTPNQLDHMIDKL